MLIVISTEPLLSTTFVNIIKFNSRTMSCQVMFPLKLPRLLFQPVPMQCLQGIHFATVGKGVIPADSSGEDGKEGKVNG